MHFFRIQIDAIKRIEFHGKGLDDAVAFLGLHAFADFVIDIQEADGHVVFITATGHLELAIAFLACYNLTHHKRETAFLFEAATNISYGQQIL